MVARLVEAAEDRAAEPHQVKVGLAGHDVGVEDGRGQVALAAELDGHAGRVAAQAQNGGRGLRSARTPFTRSFVARHLFQNRSSPPTLLRGGTIGWAIHS